jgi:hypothetical protein
MENKPDGEESRRMWWVSERDPRRVRYGFVARHNGEQVMPEEEAAAKAIQLAELLNEAVHTTNG